ncbi:MAG: hypothetical protein K5872_06230 [Rhizobiaceae bacterium]|nr:hypothetical protein [Rhizobiaceae bacterium]MCV0405811.1 hypothetical protein [Rhizobiaceae bacterium]
MPIRELAREKGSFSPEELDLMARAFARAADEVSEAGEREAIASRVLANYLAGIEDEDELAALSRRPLSR